MKQWGPGLGAEGEGSKPKRVGSRHVFRGVRVGEASNPGPPMTRSRARMEEEAETALSGLQAALTRIDDFSDHEPCMHT